MFINRDRLAVDAIKEELKSGGWMSRSDLAKATGFSVSMVNLRTVQMCMNEEIEARTRFLKSGGRFKEYRLTQAGDSPECGVVWKPLELDRALGGVTFPVTTIKHPKPSVRHRVFF